jgi:hypothetical protein
MKGIVNYTISFILTIGIIFITTDCENYFGAFNHHLVTKTAPANEPGDVEHTHVSHHITNDLISDISEVNFHPESTTSIKAGKTLPSVEFNHFTSIWQPPKFS